MSACLCEWGTLQAELGGCMHVGVSVGWLGVAGHPSCGRCLLYEMLVECVCDASSPKQPSILSMDAGHHFGCKIPVPMVIQSTACFPASRSNLPCPWVVDESLCDHQLCPAPVYPREMVCQAGKG